MPDGQDYGWQPQAGDGQQNAEAQPWQPPYPQGPPPPPYPPPGMPWQHPSYGQPPPNPPTQVLYGPLSGPQGRKPWPARHKVLTAFLAFCGLVFVIGIAAAAGSSSSSTPAAATSSLIAKVPVATPSPTVKKAATAAQTVTPSPPTQTTSAPPSTRAQTTAAPQRTAPSTPAQTTPAAPPASTTAASCYPLSDEGHCYEPGEFCRTSDHGKSGVAGDGEAIKCEDNDGWRWEPV
jgi:hypothetical protein